MELIQNQYDQYTLRVQTEQQREVSAEVIVPDTQADVYSVLTAFAACQIKQRTLRQDALKGLISKESPIGKVLLGKKVGDRFQVEVSETYSYWAVVRSITKQTDDGSAPIL